MRQCANFYRGSATQGESHASRSRGVSHHVLKESYRRKINLRYAEKIIFYSDFGNSIFAGGVRTEGGGQAQAQENP